MSFCHVTGQEPMRFQVCIVIFDVQYTKNWCEIYFETVVTQKFLVNFTKNYEETTNNTLNETLHFEVERLKYFIVKHYILDSIVWTKTGTTFKIKKNYA